MWDFDEIQKIVNLIKKRKLWKQYVFALIGIKTWKTGLMRCLPERLLSPKMQWAES